MHRDDEDFGVGRGFADLARGFDTRHGRQNDVHDDKVRLQLHGLLDRVLAIERLAANLAPRNFGERGFETPADKLVIVDD